MNQLILPLEDSPKETIDSLSLNHFFSSTNFAELWRTVGGSPVCCLLQSDGRTVVCLTGVEFGQGPFKSFQSMPNGCYSKLLISEEADINLSNAIELIAELIKSKSYRKTIITDFDGSWTDLKGFKSQEYETIMVDISAADWMPPDSKLRQQIRKAEREGIEIEKFDSDQHLDGFLRLVKLHETRRGVRSKYNRRFFEALSEIAKKDKRVIWKWCERDGQPAASSIFFREGFREGDSIIHWQMYYDEKFSHLQSTKYIPYQVAREAAAAGIKYFNLGATPVGAEGARLYKSKWGGEAVPYKCYTHKNWLGKI